MSQNLKMLGVRVWESEKKQFGEVSDLEVNAGKIRSITPKTSNSKEPIRYILPGFCDASVTIGANSFGGQTNREILPQLLLGFLATGFSHVESVGDGDLTKVKEEVLKSRMTGPFILQSQKPWVYDANFKEDAPPKEQYFALGLDSKSLEAGDGKQNRSRHQPIFLKKAGGQSFPQTTLFQWKSRWDKQGYTPIAYTFADRLAWEDALDTGFPVIFHPMPGNANLSRVQTRQFLWAPLMNVSYFLSLKNDPKSLSVRLQQIGESFPYFKEKFLSNFLAGLEENGDFEKANREKSEFYSLWETFRKEHKKERLLFASGSGHWASFPGVGAIQEISLWETAWNTIAKEEERKKETEISLPWWKRIFARPDTEELGKIRKDPDTLPSERKELVQILTEKTCGFIGADHEGKIAIGKPAHFSVFKENPLKKPLGIFAIESMVLGGKLVYTPKPEKVGKKP
ncbi:hypothetical protein [Leptospira sp. 'Mane']|uniref:hypothetical protein n=1 Tax=Leptospira sp. 'Mane' TaxID=3387407 RepID=UPI00398AA2FA